MIKLIFIILVIFSVTAYSQVFTVYHGEKGILALDTSNNIWAESSGTMRKFDGNNWTTVSHSCIKPYTGTVFPYVIDKHSSIWTTLGEFIYKYNETSGECKQYQWLVDSVPNQSLKKIINDKFGNLWFIIEFEPSMNLPGTGLFKIENDTAVLKAGWLWPESFGDMIADNNGDVWFSTTETNLNETRLYRYDITIDSLIRIYGGCGNPTAVDTSNHIWSGWSEFDGATCINHNASGSCLNNLGAFTVYSLVIDQSDVKWFGTSKGLIRYDGVTCVIYDTTNSEIPQMNVGYFVIDKQNNLWFNSSKSSIGEYNIVKACGLIDTCLTVVSPKLQTPSPKLQIYPNPTGNNIKISLPAEGKETSVSIYNISGSEVFKEKYKANEIEINTENFPKGVYLIKINSGSEVFNEKVVIN